MIARQIMIEKIRFSKKGKLKLEITILILFFTIFFRKLNSFFNANTQCLFFCF
jgi:hypothetical protein